MTVEAIRYFKHKEIDKKKWDDCLDHAINAMPYAYSWYLDIVAEKKWDALVAGDYEAVFPLPFKNRIVFKQLYQPFFTQQSGLFYRTKKYAGKTDDFIQAIPTQFKKRNLQLNTHNVISSVAIHHKMKLTHHLDLGDSYAKISSAYSNNLKRNLKKAAAAQLIFTDQVAVTQLIGLREKYLTGELKGVQDASDTARLKKLIQKAIQLDKGFIVGVKDASKQLMASVFFLKSNGQIIYLSAVSSDAGKELHAMSFLIDNMIRQNAGSDKIFDFEGSMIPGVARFFKSFGANEMHFPVLVK